MNLIHFCSECGIIYCQRIRLYNDNFGQGSGAAQSFFEQCSGALGFVSIGQP